MPVMYNPFNPPIDAIIGSLYATVEKLENRMHYEAQEASRKTEQAAQLLTEANEHSAANARADRIITRILSIVE